jgi:hypothetical protein
MLKYVILFSLLAAPAVAEEIHHLTSDSELNVLIQEGRQRFADTMVATGRIYGAQQMLACLETLNLQGPYLKDQVEDCARYVVLPNRHQIDMLQDQEKRQFDALIKDAEDSHHKFEELYRRWYEVAPVACAPATRDRTKASDEACESYARERATACAPSTRDRTKASDEVCESYARERAQGRIP